MSGKKVSMRFTAPSGKTFEEITNWDDITSYDSIVRSGARFRIKALETRNPEQCENLRKIGRAFYFCGFRLPKGLEPQFNSLDPIYQRKIEVEELERKCMGNYKKCIIIKNKEP
ncbi:hypothetical protein KY308_02190 [Candidatus Woesearchaeota archaeon]|nr:hypothetical protein [Candidatus Woesearchaeota archaeon]